MLRRWSDRLQARLGDAGAEVRLSRRRLRGGWRALAQVEISAGAAAEFDAVADALERALAELRAQGHRLAALRCDLAIGDAWMLYDVVHAELDDAPARQTDALVAASLADLAGGKPEPLAVRWQRQGAARHVACGLPAAALRRLQEALDRHDVRLGAVDGELVHAFNARRHVLSARRSVLAVARPCGTQLGLVVDGGLAAVRFEAGVDEPTLLLERSHALIRCAGFDPAAFDRYCIDDAPAAETAAPWERATSPVRRTWRAAAARLDLDLSPTRPRVPAASWLLLAAGALAIAASGWRLQAANVERLQQADDVLALQASLDRARGGHRGPVSAQDARAARAAAAVAQQLQVPWPALLAALESLAGRDVALLSIEPSAARQELRIVAEAKSAPVMLDYLDALRAGSLREVVLASHRVQANVPGVPIRFQARAQWGAADATRVAGLAGDGGP